MLVKTKRGTGGRIAGISRQRRQKLIRTIEGGIRRKQVSRKMKGNWKKEIYKAIGK